jgi:hypothetical protein
MQMPKGLDAPQCGEQFPANESRRTSTRLGLAIHRDAANPQPCYPVEPPALFASPMRLPAIRCRCTLLTGSFIMWKRCPAGGRGRVGQRQSDSTSQFAAINSPSSLRPLRHVALFKQQGLDKSTVNALKARLAVLRCTRHQQVGEQRARSASYQSARKRGLGPGFCDRPFEEPLGSERPSVGPSRG